MSDKQAIIKWFTEQGATIVSGCLQKEGVSSGNAIPAVVSVDIDKSSPEYENYYFDDGKDFVDGWCSEEDDGEFTLADFQGLYFKIFPASTLRQ